MAKRHLSPRRLARSLLSRAALGLLLVSGCAGRQATSEESKEPSSAPRPPTPPSPAASSLIEVYSRVHPCQETANQAARSASERLVVVQQLVNRGCPRQAVALLDETLSDKTQSIAGSFPEWAALLGIEANLDAIGNGFDGSGNTLWLPEPQESWMWKDLPGSREGYFSLIEKGLQSGRLPVEVRSNGRLARAKLRAWGAGMDCLDSIGTEYMREAFVQLNSMRMGLVQELGLMNETAAAATRNLALASMLSCDLASAKKLFVQAAERYDQEGRTGDALDARLSAIEADLFPGGRAGTMVIGALASKDLATLAAYEEAAVMKAGPYAMLAGAIEEELSKAAPAASSQAPDDSQRSRMATIRSVAALRLRQNPTEALELAAQAVALAAGVKRADLMYGGAAVAAVALLELDRASEAEQLLKRIDSSLAERGVPGARFHLAKVFDDLSMLMRQRTRSELAIRLARASRIIAEKLPPMQRLGRLMFLPDSLEGAGYLEDALADIDASIQKLSTGDPAGPQQLVDSVLDMLREKRFQLLASLGQDEARLAIVAADPEASFDLEIGKASLSGDNRKIASLLDSNLKGSDSSDEATALRMANLMKLMGAGYCNRICAEGKDYLANMLRLTRKNRDKRLGIVGRSRNVDEMLERTTLVGGMYGFGVQLVSDLVSCGVVSRDPAVVRLGQDMERELFSEDLRSPQMEAWMSASAMESEGKYKQAAAQYLSLAGQALEKMEVNSQSGIGTFQGLEGFYSRAVACLLQQQPADIASAVAALESSRARDLRAARALRATSLSGSPDAAIVALERNLAQEQARLRNLAQLAGSTEDPKVREALDKSMNEARQRIEGLANQRDAATRVLGSANPAAYRAAALAPPPSLADIQSRLGQDESLVYYILDAEQAWAIVVDKGAAHVEKLVALGLDHLPLIRSRIARFRTVWQHSLETGRGIRVVAVPGKAGSAVASEPAAVLEELYKLLVTPLERWIPAGRRVIIVPDPLTTDLPFAALGPPDHPWVGRNPIRILPGAFMLKERQGQPPPAGEVLVVGDPALGSGPTAKQRGSTGATAAGFSWRQLSGARAESQEVSQLLGGTLLLGADATEEKVRTGLSSADFVHLATHGLADVVRPSTSALILSQPAAGSAEDGILYAYEVERIKMKARMVVLSACETGRGQPRGFEGTLALDRAFLTAGAQAVVSSMWVVDDRSTGQLMTAFYGELRAGRPADVALAHAMVTVREQKQWRDPFYWAAFRLVGDGLR